MEAAEHGSAAEAEGAALAVSGEGGRAGRGGGGKGGGEKIWRRPVRSSIMLEGSVGPVVM